MRRTDRHAGEYIVGRTYTCAAVKGDGCLPDGNFRTVRGYQLQSRSGGQLTPALEDYLEMVYRQCLQYSYARVGKLSELLHVKPSSASKMISKLALLGYVEYDRYELILLTDKGRQTGEYLLKRHDTIERFLALIGCPDPLEETELIEHSLSASTVSALGCMLEYFQSDSSALAGFNSLLAPSGPNGRTP